jgi:dienelactone hydrolase
MKKWMPSIALSMLLLAASAAFGASSVPVNVKDGDKTYLGTLYIPTKAKGPLPMVVVVHEWWGKDGFSDSRAKRIADELGYAALSVDLFGEGKVAQNPPEAQGLSGPFYKDPQIGVKRLQAFIAAAPDAAKTANASIDTSKIGAMGFCFGGTQVLNLARSEQMPNGDTLLGVVSFHGGLASSLKAPAPITTKLLVLHGADDQFVKPDEVAAFKKEMSDDKADMTFKAYPGATHAYTNPKSTENGKKFNLPLAYNAKADKESWSAMKTFFKGLFGA